MGYDSDTDLQSQTAILPIIWYQVWGLTKYEINLTCLYNLFFMK